MARARTVPRHASDRWRSLSVVPLRWTPGRKAQRSGKTYLPSLSHEARRGHAVVPLPEGSRYLGFIFSRAATPAEAEAFLRRAHALLEFKIR